MHAHVFLALSKKGMEGLDSMTVHGRDQFMPHTATRNNDLVQGYEFSDPVYAPHG